MSRWDDGLAWQKPVLRLGGSRCVAMTSCLTCSMSQSPASRHQVVSTKFVEYKTSKISPKATASFFEPITKKISSFPATSSLTAHYKHTNLRHKKTLQHQPKTTYYSSSSRSSRWPTTTPPSATWSCTSWPSSSRRWPSSSAPAATRIFSSTSA
ncbi:hypothetical protein B0T24DRAFT_138482 [Lasiosphaeria ovina]|uniref:Uncharacterized protein n=1 Tax=Lasiosphaeria ovina TaxID=92902 RepID=A0AAE0NCK4_9PEZI|nr:hypothetical protein B0T24DRAFT_138482 [Lasiosphaeria ovina]